MSMGSWVAAATHLFSACGVTGKVESTASANSAAFATANDAISTAVSDAVAKASPRSSTCAANGSIFYMTLLGCSALLGSISTCYNYFYDYCTLLLPEARCVCRQAACCHISNPLMDSPGPSKIQSIVGTVLSIYIVPGQPGPTLFVSAL